jgi:MFS family permease
VFAQSCCAARSGDIKLNEATAGDSVVITEAHGRKTTRSLFGILCYQGYAFAILGVGAPFIGKSFGLDQSGIARMYAWISLNSIGALVLSRMADRIGRRRILRFGLLITPLGSLGALLASSPA